MITLARISMTRDELLARITHLRQLIIVHSAVFYLFHTRIVEDSQFDLWCYELMFLQDAFPEEAQQCMSHWVFKYLDGPSGRGLPFRHPRWVRKASELIRMAESRQQIVGKGV